MWIAILAIIIVLALIGFGIWAAMSVEDQPTAMAGQTLVTPAPLGTASAATIASAVTPAATPTLSALAGASSDQIAATDDSQFMAVINVYRARWPPINAVPKVTLSEATLNTIVTPANANSWPDSQSTTLAYTTMQARAAIPSIGQNLANEFSQAKLINKRVVAVQTILAGGFLCGKDSKEAAMMGCTLTQTSAPTRQGCVPAGTYWGATATATRDSANIAQGTVVCVGAPVPAAYSLVTGANYPDPRGVYNPLIGQWSLTPNGLPRNIYVASRASSAR
jgi:hypothetical protein